MSEYLNISGLRSYYGQIQALHGIDFELAEGSVTTLLGANGAGKTTTLRAICGMVRSTGKIEFDGRQLIGLSTEAVVKLGIAHVPQGRGTFTTLTVEENLQLGAITRPSKAEIASDIERMYSMPVRRALQQPDAVRRRAADAGGRPRTDLRPRYCCSTSLRSASPLPSASCSDADQDQS